MYKTSHFQEEDRDKLKDFIKENPFALLNGIDTHSKPVATHVPLILESRNDNIYLQGHMMKATDHYRAFKDNNSILAVFSGPHAYISATWYENPNMASTWNYMSVHAKGVIHFMDNKQLILLMKKLTLSFEDSKLESPTIYDNLSESYLKRTMNAIVGFEIKVSEIEGVFKLSQDKDKESYDNTITELKKGNYSSKALAEEMEKRYPF